MISTIYISHDGMTDPLGGSQVIPYLKGLSEQYKIYLISFEKPSRNDRKNEIAKQLSESGIEWIPLEYRNSPPVLSTILDIRKAAAIVKKLIKKQDIKILHCRSYIGALIGTLADKNKNCKHIFDMRGFWPDERVDGKIWNLKNPIHNMVYSYFKRFEKKHIPTADQVVVLTYKAKNYLNAIHFTRNPIKVIPCAADLDHFNYAGDPARTRNRSLLGLKDEIAICYLGSIGSWYLLDEMLDFFKVLNQMDPNSKFVVFTPDKPEHIIVPAKKKQIDTDLIYIQEASRKELPELLSAVDAGIFFIKPCFSKMASSPTKHGELLGMGLEVVCNSNVGDIDKIHQETNTGIVLSGFDQEELETAATQLLEKIKSADRKINRDAAEKWYSLSKGITIYEEIYADLSK